MTRPNQLIRVVAAAFCAVAASCSGPPCQDGTIMATKDPNGHVTISVGVLCPGLRVSSFSLSPIAVSLGGAIDVSAAGEDATDAATFTFAWTAPTGTFADPKASHTKYTCTAPGTVTLTVTVSNGDCRATAGMGVTCEGTCSGAACDGGTG
jgi:hypothetical protein